MINIKINVIIIKVKELINSISFNSEYIWLKNFYLAKLNKVNSIKHLNNRFSINWIMKRIIY